MKSKPRPPTVEEFLQYKPKRQEYLWEVDKEGIVCLTVPKFTSKLGISFCKLVRKENQFTAHFDRIGSLVWQHCDGEHTVQDIYDILKTQYPQEKNLDQRLFLFLQQMNALNYLTY